jgi:hypothetical protein
MSKVIGNGEHYVAVRGGVLRACEGKPCGDRNA